MLAALITVLSPNPLELAMQRASKVLKGEDSGEWSIELSQITEEKLQPEWFRIDLTKYAGFKWVTDPHIDL